MALAARKCITGLRNDSLPLVPRCQLPLFPAQTASEPWAGSSPPSSILQLSAASTAGGAYVLKSNGDPGFYRDFGRREISQEGFPQTWNSQKKKKKKKKKPKNILDQISFAQGSCAGIQTAPPPQNWPCCVEENGATVDDIPRAKGRKDTGEKCLQKTGDFQT